MYFSRTILLIFIYIFNVSHAEVVLLNENTNNTSNNENESNNKKEINKNKTSITFDPNIFNNKENKDDNKLEKKVNNEEEIITYFTFGTEGKLTINVYISPSCLHCAQFLAEDLQKFINKHKNECFIKVILIPYLARDFFVMKIMQKKSKNSEDYYGIFSRYMKRAVATIDSVHVNKEQKALYVGSNTDPDMIKYQVVAKEFGFTDEEIIKAIPNMNEDYELKVIKRYKTTLQEISNILQLDNSKQQEIDVPLIVCNGKTHKTLNDAFNSCNKNV